MSNEKYIGNVRLLNNREGEVHYLPRDSIPAIISKDIYEKVQNEKVSRTNIMKSKDGKSRKSTKYSSKKKR